MLNFITHATGDDHINDARFDEFDEAINKLIFGRTVTVERIGIAGTITATGIDRALRKGPTTYILCAHVSAFRVAGGRAGGKFSIALLTS